MAQSKCASCNNTRFEVVENTPAHSRYKINFVQCSSCGSVIGALEYFNAGTLIKEVEEKVDKLSGKIDNLGYLNSSLTVINQNIAKLHRLIESKLDK